VEVSYPAEWAARLPLNGVAVTIEGVADTLRTDVAGKAGVTLDVGKTYKFVAARTVRLDTVENGQPGVRTLVLVGQKGGVSVSAANSVVAIPLAVNDEYWDGDTSPRIPVVLTLKLPARFAADGLDTLLKGLAVSLSGTADASLVADENGIVSRSLRYGDYSFATAKTSTVELAKTYNSEQGRLDVNFQGTLSVKVTTLNAALELVLEVADSTFTPFGDISGPEAVRLHYKGDTVTLAGLFSGSLDYGTPRLEYAITAQPEKREIGFGVSAWTPLGNVYSLANGRITANDSLPASWDLPAITDKRREVKPAELTVKLYRDSEGTPVRVKTFPVVQDSVVKEIIKIEATQPVTSNNDWYRVDNNTLTLAIPYTSGTTFGGTFPWLSFSDSTFRNAASSTVIPPDYPASPIRYIYYVAIDGFNDGSPDNLNEAAAINLGSPISRQTATSTYSYYLMRPTSVPAPAVGSNGYFDIYPYGTSKEDWRAIKVTVKPTTVTGVIPPPNDDYLLGTPARRFRTGVQASVTVIFYGFLTVAEGKARNYVANENDGASLLLIPDSWNSNANGALIEPFLGNGSARNASFCKEGKTINSISTDPTDYHGYAQMQLTTANKDAAAGTEITFKACPKNHFSNDGVPDPAWTINVTTKVYAD
jgi:hypothetical protein